jgi:hypothetical protein
VKNDIGGSSGASYKRPIAELARQACSPHFFQHSCCDPQPRPRIALAAHAWDRRDHFAFAKAK